MFILPFNRDVSDGKTPLLVLVLIVVNAFMLPAAYLDPKAIFQQYGFIPAHPTVLAMFTSMFLHAGFWHIAGNMFFLWMFGNRVEQRFGSVLFGAVYLACGLAGNGLHLLLNPGSTIPTVGASGAISGIVGAYFVFFPKSRFDLDIYVGWWHIKTIPARTHAAVGAWIGEQLLLGIISQFTHSFGVAFWAHVGGFLSGVAVAFFYNRLVPMPVEKHKRKHRELDGAFEEANDAEAADSGLTLLDLNRPR